MSLRIWNYLVCWLLLTCGFELSAAPLSTGEKIYKEYCSVCHGDRGDGRSRSISRSGEAKRGLPLTVQNSQFIPQPRMPETG